MVIVVEIVGLRTVLVGERQSVAICIEDLDSGSIVRAGGETIGAAICGGEVGRQNDTKIFRVISRPACTLDNCVQVERIRRSLVDQRA